MADGVSQQPAAATDASQRIFVTVAPRGTGDCYDEAMLQSFLRRLTFSIQDDPLEGPVVRQIAPPTDLSAVWIPIDSSAGYAAGVNHIWNGVAWVPVVSQVAISGDTNNAIFTDPSGALKVNLPARLHKEQVVSGPNPTVTISWTPAEYSLGDEIAIVGFLFTAGTPANMPGAGEISRSSTSWTGAVVDLAAGESVTLVLEFNQPMTKGD